MNEEYNLIREIAGWLTAGMFGAYVGLKKLLAMGAAEDTRAAYSRADESLINNMRAELERLCGQNSMLADTLNDLQKKMADMSAEVWQLRAENTHQANAMAELHAENGRLRQQVTELQREIISMRFAN